MEITDEMLFEHAARARDIWLGTLLADEDIPEIQTSKKFEKKMQRLLKEQRRDPRMNKMLMVMKRTVAAVLVVATISFGGLMTVEAYRAKVVEIVVHVFHELTDYRFASKKTEVSDIVLPEISLERVPEGMREVENRITGNNRRIVLYEGDDGLFFELTQRPIGSDGAYTSILDTEDSAYEMIAINGREGYSNEKGGSCSIVWTIDSIVYRLYGNIEMSELKNIAEKIKIFQN